MRGTSWDGPVPLMKQSTVHVVPPEQTVLSPVDTTWIPCVLGPACPLMLMFSLFFLAQFLHAYPALRNDECWQVKPQ